MLKRLSLLFVIIFSFQIHSQEPVKELITIDKILQGSYFARPFGGYKWYPCESGYTVIKPSKSVQSGSDIVYINPKNSEETILVDASLLKLPGTDTPLPIESYYWSDDCTKLLIYNNSKKVWRYNTRGDYYFVDLNSGIVKKLGGDAEPSTLMFAKISPNSDKVAFVKKHNIYVEDLQTGKITQLTSDGTDRIINGTFDWVYEEEFSIQDGFRWSPDGKKIAFWRLDATNIKNFLMINNTDSLYPFTIPVEYPKAGQENSACSLGVVDIESGKTVWAKNTEDPKNSYIARVDWFPSGNSVLFQYLNRNQDVLELRKMNASSGDISVLYKEEDTVWIEINDEIIWLSGSDNFIWLSEKDGWKKPYLADGNSGKMTQLYSENMDVISVSRYDKKNNLLYFIASPGNATQKYLYSVPLSGESEANRITPLDLKGTNNYNISSDASYAVHTFNNANKPATSNLIELPSHTVIKNLVSNDALEERISKLEETKVEFFEIETASGVKMDGYRIVPPNFDPAKKYPALFYVYGEPAAQTALDSYDGFFGFWHRMLAQKGVIVYSLDNRGTPAPKGKEWRKAFYKNSGVVPSDDQAGAITALIEQNSYVDATKVAMWGWSGGGATTLMSLFRYPGLLKAGIAIASISDLKFYDTIYMERYMGLPQDDPKAYKRCSPVTYAKDLDGSLLLIHGTGDDNVHYQNAEVLINELVANNKVFDLMIYPNRSHSLGEGKGTYKHLFYTLTNYIEKKLLD